MRRSIPIVELSVAAAIAIYLFTFQIVNFPPYFFCDEAISGLDANSLITTGADIHGARWPIFFEGFGDYALSLTVYLQIPFNIIFGMNEFSVRLRTAIISLLGITFFSAILWRNGLRTVAWLPFLLFSVSPVWFLHSRTGFEYVVASVFYLSFMFAYLLALHKEDGAWLIAGSIAASLCFYSYTPARGWVIVAAALLAVVNIRFHLKHMRASVGALCLGLALLSPFIYAFFVHPEIVTKRFQAVGGGEFTRLSLDDQFRQIISNYVTALNPEYWFSLDGTVANSVERHILPRLSALPLWMAPCFALGMLLIIIHFWRIRERSILCFLLAIPLPAAMASMNHERVMAISAIYIAIAVGGISWLFYRLGNRRAAAYSLSCALFLVLALYAYEFNRYVHNFAFRRYNDYGFYGVQAGARRCPESS